MNRFAPCRMSRGDSGIKWIRFMLELSSKNASGGKLIRSPCNLFIPWIPRRVDQSGSIIVGYSDGVLRCFSVEDDNLVFWQYTKPHSKTIALFVMMLVIAVVVVDKKVVYFVVVFMKIMTRQCRSKAYFRRGFKQRQTHNSSITQ